MAVEEYANNRWWFSMRSLIVMMCSTGIIVMGIERFNINIAVVCMVNSTDPSTNTTSPPDDNGNIRWSSAQIGFVFSAVYWGNLVTVLPAGWLADKYGGAIVWFIGVCCSVIGSLLTPILAEQAFVFILLVRFLIGLGQGLRQPCMSSIISKWIPVNEMSFSIGLITAGMQLSTVISNLIGAALCLTNFLGGWPSIFYVSALFGIAWCIVWPVLVRSSPEDSRWISDSEKRFISENLKEMKKVPKKVPYKAIALSPAIWAMNLANFAGTLGNYTVSMYMPLFFQQVLGIPIAQNGLFSALPLLTQYIGVLVQSFIADKLKAETNLNHDFISKLFNSIACFGEGILLILVGYLSLNSAGAVVGLICLATTLSAGFTPGWWTSIQTVAPPFSGKLQSLSSFFSIIASIITPYIASGLTPNGTKDEWEHVFVIVGSFLIIGGLAYAIFGKATPQKWSYEENPEKIKVADEAEVQIIVLKF